MTNTQPQDGTQPATIADLRRGGGFYLVDEGLAQPDVTLDWSTSSQKRIAIDAPTRVTFAGGIAGGCYTLELASLKEGACVAEWGNNIHWGPGPISPIARHKNILAVYFDGAAYHGNFFVRDIPLDVTERR